MTLYKAGPLTVEATENPRQFSIDAETECSPDGVEWEKAYTSISGYFGSYGPHVFAAAPDLLALCEMVNGSFGGGRVVTFSDDDISQFAAVIAKAKGGAQ
jgi:hypothetical protein